MATLTANISATARVIQVTGGEAVDPGFRFRLDDELLELSGFDPYPLIGGYRQSGPDRTRWRVNRAVGESAAATHSAGATLKAAVSASVNAENLTPPAPFPVAGGAGGLTVDNTVDPPAEVTTLIAQGATISGDEATLATAGEQTISKIGPFRFNFDETDNFKELAALDQGVIVVLAWPEIITPFGSGPDANLELYVGPIAGTWLLIGQWFADSDAQTTVDAGGAPNILGTTVAHLQGGMPRPTRVKTAGNSLVAVLNPSAPNTAGAADIYALIATPTA